MSDAFSPEEVAQLRHLLEMEAIRKVRLLYSHLMDSQQVDALADLFTVDALCEFGPDYGSWAGREVIRANYHEVFSGESAAVFYAMHNTCNHWVELTGPTSAVGRSYLIDVVTSTPPEGMPIVWFGVYDEAYEKVEGSWLIARCSLQFLWPKRSLTDGFPQPFPKAASPLRQ